MSTAARKFTPRMSDEAVSAKTGKTWKEWFTILNKAGAKKMSHQEIVTLLHTKYGVGPWWVQMVTATYEQQSGKRSTHERPDGFQISVSRTVNSPLAKLFKSFANETARDKWLGEDGIVIRKSNSNKSLRITWKDKKTSLEINFYPKDKGKSQVVVQHTKLPSAAAATRMKGYWSAALDRLRTNLEQ